jgi:peptidoglycan/LPS O-acetylase OafA/YrhL
MPPLRSVAYDIFSKGYFGVSIFFVISGFLITRNALIRYGDLSNISIQQFYLMRAARIVPCLFLFLTSMTILFLLGLVDFVPTDSSLIRSGIINALVFRYNNFYLTEGNVHGMLAWSPLWSLSIEETFYLTFPLACIISRKRSVFVLGLLALIAYGPFVRLQYIGMYRYFGNADLLSLGCLAAITERHLRQCISTRFSIALYSAGVIVTLTTIIFSTVDPDHFWASSIIGVGAAMFLIGAASSTGLRPWPPLSFLAAPLAAFGRASYEVYLFHVALIILFGTSLQRPLGTFVGSLIMLAMLLALGTALSVFFTGPINRALRTISFRRQPLRSSFKPVHPD